MSTVIAPLSSGAERPLSRALFGRALLPVAFAGALGLLLLLRVLEPTRLPMFLDEAANINRGFHALQAKSLADLFDSLDEGKAPLVSWLLVPGLALSDNRFLAARLTLATVGLANGLLLARIAYRLSGWRVALVALALYAISPQTLFYDRIVLQDSVVLATSLLTLAFTLHWSAKPTLARAALLGVAMGLGLLTKLNAALFMAAAPVVAWSLLPRQQWARLAQFGLSYLLALALFSVLLVDPRFSDMLSGKNTGYWLSVAEIARLPVATWWSNASVYLLHVPATYLTPPVLALGLLGGALCLAKRTEGAALVPWIGLPLLALVLVVRQQYTRYELFAVAPLLVLAAMAGVWLLDATAERLRAWRAGRRGLLAGRLALAMGAGLTLLPSAQFDAALIFDPDRAPLATVGISDRGQYIESWSAGHGLAEAAAIILAEAQVRPVLVYTWTALGISDWAHVTFAGRPNIYVGHLHPEEPIAKTVAGYPPSDPRSRLRSQNGIIYYVQNQAVDTQHERDFIERNPQARLIAEYFKPGGKSRVQLFRISFADLAKTGD